MVDEVIALDKENREIKQEVEALRAERNRVSKEIGKLMGQGKREEAEEIKKKIAASGDRIEELTVREREVEEEIRKRMMFYPADYRSFCANRKRRQPECGNSEIRRAGGSRL